MNTTDEITRLKAAAERAQAGYHHEEAIAYFTQALGITPPGGDHEAQVLRYDLHIGRGHSYEWVGDVLAAMDDFETAVRLTE
jgi:tetratricopeptide (TPR) repeat protein